MKAKKKLVALQVFTGWGSMSVSGHREVSEAEDTQAEIMRLRVTQALLKAQVAVCALWVQSSRGVDAQICKRGQLPQHAAGH